MSLLTSLLLTDSIEKGGPGSGRRPGGGQAPPSSLFEHERAARQASTRANFTNKPEHHAYAAKMHREAASAFGAKGDREKQQSHERLAAFHERKAASVGKGGPGSGRHAEGGSQRFTMAGGRHSGTGMTHQEFGHFAAKVGMALNENRAKENSLRAAGNHEAANRIYDENKGRVKGILDEHGVTPQAFDHHMGVYSKASGSRPPNVKLSRMFMS